MGASERNGRFSGGNGSRNPARSPGKQQRKMGMRKEGRRGKKEQDLRRHYLYSEKVVLREGEMNEKEASGAKKSIKTVDRLVKSNPIPFLLIFFLIS